MILDLSKSLSRARNLLLLIIALCFLTACANPPIKVNDAVLKKSPADVSSEGQAAGAGVVWGGVIVSAHNLSDRTQLEVLSYPLSKNQIPKTDSEPTGRFLIQTEGYLELADFRTGRLITVLGTLQGVTRGSVGEADYRYPTVTSTDLHLWPAEQRTKSGLVFGIGVSIGG